MKSLNFVITLLAFSSLRSESTAKKILGLEFFGTKSHVITYLPLLEELQNRGHQVTLLSPSQGLSKPGGIREIFTFEINDAFDNLNKTFFEIKEENLAMNPISIVTEHLPRHCSALYDRVDVQALMEEEWDLIIFQPMMNDCALGFVHRIMEKNKAPLILFSPTAAPGFLVAKTGGHHPHSFVPNIFLGYTDEMTFYQRFMNNFANTLWDAMYYFYYIPVMERVYKDKLGEDFPSSDAILDKASLTLSNGHYSLSKPRPNLPDVVDVGGIHSRPVKPLPKELEEFVAGSGDDGFIFFSLGTGLKSYEMAVDKRNMILNAFSKLKQRVIWKYEQPENVPNVPANVKLMKWAPQQDLLGHPKMRLFITHCGLGGTEEAIYHAVPLLGMPFFGDQDLNAQEAENHGYLYKINWIGLTEQILLDGINEVLNEPKYRENVKKLSNVFRDQIDDPLKRAVWWVEYVLRHNGAPQLRSAARKLNFFQYHSFDVYAVFLLILSLIIYLPYRILKFAWKKIRGSGKTTTKVFSNGIRNGVKNGIHKKMN